MTSRVEEIVQRNPPCAFRSPQGGAEPDQPRTVPCARWLALMRAHGLTVRLGRRQRALEIELMIAPICLSWADAGSSPMTVK